jgi:translation initiation factor 1
MKNSPPSRLVYSTDFGRACPGCGKPMGQCICRQPQAPASDGTIRVQRETKGRGGKAVTVVRGAPVDAAGLVKLGQDLKAACGSGGTVKDGTIEVQGDHVEKVVALLQGRGFKVKRAGG